MTFDTQPVHSNFKEGLVPESKDVYEEVTEEKKCFDILACEKSVEKVFSVQIPVFIKPYAEVLEPEVKCIGDVRLNPECKHCRKDFENRFVITQQISVLVPVKYRAVICYGKECVSEDK